jgi:outer membrane protein OmpA-like peptidoglycan-associated protein
MTRKWSSVLALAVVATLVLSGCATKKYVQQEIANQSDKIQSVESAVEANQARIKEVDGKADGADRKAGQAQMTSEKAMDRGNEAFAVAEEAMLLAVGELILEETLTNDITQFAVNKAELPDGGVGELDTLARKILDMNMLVYVEIQGHTDSTGSEMWNMELGERRAESVRRYLNERGIPLFAIAIISYGESNPLADNTSREGRSQNRRVVIRVLK